MEKINKLREDLLVLGCKNWGFWGAIQYNEFHGIPQRIPTAVEYLTKIASLGKVN